MSSVLLLCNCKISIVLNSLIFKSKQNSLSIILSSVMSSYLITLSTCFAYIWPWKIINSDGAVKSVRVKHIPNLICESVRPQLSSSFGPRETLDRKSTRRSSGSQLTCALYLGCVQGCVYVCSCMFYESSAAARVAGAARGCISSRGGHWRSERAALFTSARVCI